MTYPSGSRNRGICGRTSPTATGSMYARVVKSALVGDQRQRFIRGKLKRFIPHLFPDRRMDTFGVARPGGNGSTMRRWIRASSSSHALSTKARNAWRLDLLPGETISTMDDDPVATHVPDNHRTLLSAVEFGV